MKKAALFPALVTVLLVPALASAYQVDTLMDNGPSSNRIDIVILGDGYTSADQTQFNSDATALVNALFAATPWKEYRTLFNVKAIHVTSNQTGADNGTYGVTRDTALDAAFGCQGIDRLLCVNDTTVLNIAAQATPEYDLALVVVNDPKYGGSGGSVPVASINSNSGEIVIHELGHSLGGLADEYSDPYPGYPSCGTECTEANATPNGTSTVKWKAWIPTGTQIPTPASGSTTGPIGVFEGCRYQTTGMYRPKDEGCRMRALGYPYCSVCTEAMVKAFWNRVSMFDTESPAQNPSAAQCSSLTFAVTSPLLQTNTYQYAWTVAGNAQGSSGPSLTAADVATVGSPVQVTVKIQDDTQLVRDDPQHILEDSYSWALNASSGQCQSGVCDEGITCLSDGGCTVSRKAPGSSCGTESCSAGVVSGSACDSSGACVPGNSTSCGAFSCDDAGVRCRTQCRFDSDCASGHLCVNEACVAPVPDAGVDAGSKPIILPYAGNAPTPPAPQGCGCNGIGGIALSGLAALLFAMRKRR